MSDDNTIEIDDDSVDVEVEETGTEETVSEDSKVEVEASEEGSDDELERYSKNVQKRIRKLTDKSREDKFDREEAVRVAKMLQEENSSLKVRMQQLDTGYMAEYGGRLQSQKAAAHSLYKEAHENGDSESLLSAQEALSRIAIEEQRYGMAKARQEQQAQAYQNQPPPQPRPVQAQAQPVQQPVDPKAKAWTEKNSWFGQDDVMTASAFAIHNRLEREGFDMGSDEYYSEIDRQLRENLPNKFSDASSKKTGGGSQVAPAGSSASRSTKSGRKTVSLTSSQVAMAKKLNVPLDRYAKEYLKSTQKANNS